MPYGIVAPRGGEMDEPHRLVRRPAVRPGDAGDGNGDGGAGMGQGAAHHGAGDVLAHRAVALDQPDRHAEHLALGGVGIGDEATLDHVRGAGNGGERRGHQAAGAGFGGGDQHPALAAGVEQRRGLGDDARVDLERVGHGEPIMAAAPWPWPWRQCLRHGR